MTDPGSPRRILIVDDDRDGADSLGLLLALDGHKTFVAYTGGAALDLLAAERPEVVFLDISMPDVSGYELCRQIRGKPSGDKLAIFALTGWAREEDRRHTSAAGFDGHLIKPVTIDALRTLLAADPRAARLGREPRRDPLGVAPAPEHALVGRKNS